MHTTQKRLSKELSRIVKLTGRVLKFRDKLRDREIEKLIVECQSLSIKLEVALRSLADKLYKREHEK